jgi:hypothetical protein
MRRDGGKQCNGRGGKEACHDDDAGAGTTPHAAFPYLFSLFHSCVSVAAASGAACRERKRGEGGGGRDSACCQVKADGEGDMQQLGKTHVTSAEKLFFLHEKIRVAAAKRVSGNERSAGGTAQQCKLSPAAFIHD